ncbi:unnamed protein product [Rhizophagus irregularis]|nr:unnamed protein product [Rhizophagus irregularis]
MSLQLVFLRHRTSNQHKTKRHKNKYHSQTEDHDHCNEPLGKVIIITPLKEPNTFPSSPYKILNYEKRIFIIALMTDLKERHLLLISSI